jgi:hypothetical protein
MPIVLREEEKSYSMSDTVKIPRPKFPRSDQGSTGRVEHDTRGNAVWVRSRATDTGEVAVDSTLSIAEESSDAAAVSGTGIRPGEIQKASGVKAGAKKPRL